MLGLVPLLISSPWVALTALGVVLAMAIIAWRRGPAMPLSGMILILTGAVGLAAAAGSPVWNRPRGLSVAVMVDVSPSTRGARFRDRVALEARIGQLLEGTPHQLYLFADANHPSGPSTPIREISVDRTAFAPPDTPAIVLFSDGQFELPSGGPPTYCVVDPGLEEVDDGAVTRLELRGDQVAATVRGGAGKTVRFSGVVGAATAPAPPGTTVIMRQVQSGATSLTAQISGGDRWKENDAMTMHLGPPPASQQWWVGTDAPGGAWWTFRPEDLPVDPASYLAPSVIVINNVPANQLSPAAMDRLAQYTRDLGGSLLILGGDSAFAAGGYPGTVLDELSPLASSPPRPTILWMLLADGSGSMASDAGGQSRWDLACAAIVKLLGRLPPEDPVQVGQFSDVLRWWPVGTNARKTAGMALPPPDALPHGPTNLEAALRRIGQESDGGMPTQLLVLSDCDTRIDDPDGLIAGFQRKKIQLHVLALEEGSALPVIRRICQETGGLVMEQLDPKLWADGVGKMLRSVMPPRLTQAPAEVQFADRAASLPPLQISRWNRTWIKDGATPWGKIDNNGETIVIAAHWRLGRGQVAAAAFAARPSTAATLAGLIAMAPRDPRLAVTWDAGRQLCVSIDAVDAKSYLNDLKLRLELADADTGEAMDSRAIEQIGPGRYEVSTAAPRRGAIATVESDGRIADRLAVAGQYAPEFDSLGNDHEAMRELAERTGGKVIWPDDRGAIDFHWPGRPVPLAPWLAAIGVVLIACGLAVWRVS